MAIKQCGKCNAAFGCTAPVEGCWCEQYTLTNESLAYLKGNYQDCLCPECLAGFAVQDSLIETPPTNKE